jgi:hypothetical protein
MRSTVHVARFEMADPAEVPGCCGEVGCAADVRRPPPKVGAPTEMGTTKERAPKVRPAADVTTSAEMATAS